MLMDERTDREPGSVRRVHLEVAKRSPCCLRPHLSVSFSCHPALHVSHATPFTFSPCVRPSLDVKV